MLDAASNGLPLSDNPRMGTTGGSAHVLPSGEQLLALERQARTQGTDLTQADLVGCWWFHQVWPKGSGTANALTSGLLRSLGARLELSTGQDGVALEISNAINLGALLLRFDGAARLIGRRPLLQFSFSRLEFSLAGRTLLRQTLPPIAPKRLPFFALIKRDASGWLAARGRGGGLALWQLRP